MVFVAMSPSVFLETGLGPFWETGGYLSSYNRPGHPKITLDTQNSRKLWCPLDAPGSWGHGGCFLVPYGPFDSRTHNITFHHMCIKANTTQTYFYKDVRPYGLCGDEPQCLFEDRGGSLLGDGGVPFVLQQTRASKNHSLCPKNDPWAAKQTYPPVLQKTLGIRKNSPPYPKNDHWASKKHSPYHKRTEDSSLKNVPEHQIE